MDSSGGEGGSRGGGGEEKGEGKIGFASVDAVVAGSTLGQALLINNAVASRWSG